MLSKNSNNRLGEIKGGQVRWDKLKKLKAKDKKELMTHTNNVTPLLSKTIDKHTDIKDKKDSGFRLYTPNPESSDELGDIHIISNEEYKMIENGEIDPEIFNDTDKLIEKQIELHTQHLTELCKEINKKYKIVHNGIEIDLTKLKLEQID